MIPWLNPTSTEFPPVEMALDEPNGLLVAGGDLSVARLLAAYKLGIFPWYNENDPILWWSPDPRSVINPAELHISKSLKKLLRKNDFSLSCDSAFKQVIQQCSKPRNYTDETWINDEMTAAYCELHKAGYAHSVEIWQNHKLVGGLYGIAIGCVFFGESMFSEQSNASKFAFVHLAQALNQCGFELLDCQIQSAHLDSLGATDISRSKFIQRLKQLTKQQPTACPWEILNSHKIAKPL